MKEEREKLASGRESLRETQSNRRKRVKKSAPVWNSSRVLQVEYRRSPDLVAR